MIVVISPAKSLNFETPSPTDVSTLPAFMKDADYLAGRLKKLNPTELAALMNISSKLAMLNADRYAGWKKATSKQALFAYDGDVYDGMNAGTFNENEIEFSQKHLRILSGLYGLLKPLDEIKPYRIEMGTPFATPKGDNLYKYWGTRITDLLKKQLKTSGTNTLINLASQEYFASVQPGRLKCRVITPTFRDKNKGEYTTISFFAKKARGMMCRYIIQNQITDFEMLAGFDEAGYLLNHNLTKGDNWVFTRG